MKGLTDIPGLLVGHATNLDALTGCTVVLCERGAVGGYDLRGSASGTAEFFVMDPGHISGKVHAVVLAGGSAFGLDAGTGVRNHLERRGIGFRTSQTHVPIVPTAILYDLGIGKSSVRPTAAMGEAACEAASNYAVLEGAVGAGTGATLGKALGMARAMKSGIGSATVRMGGDRQGVIVSAMAAVNAFGDIRNPETGKLIAGARIAPDSADLADATRVLVEGRRSEATFPRGENTTLVVVATNAKLDSVQARKLAQLAQAGLTAAITPAHTMVDGDLIVALSHGEEKAEMISLGAAAAQAVSRAIVRAAMMAPTLGGLPGLAAAPA